MAEPENFEDDLFADLYNDDEDTKAVQPAPELKPEPPAVNGSHEVKTEETVGDNYQNGEGEDHQVYNNDQDGDDEIDFNLGNSNEYREPAHQGGHGPGIKEDGKMFIGGLNWETTDQSLKDYFSQFGEVLECTVMRDGASGRSRGFGFLTFKDAKTVNIVMVKEHYLDGKIIDPKRAIPRDEQERTSKIFVGGVSQEATEQDFKEYFQQFGRVVDATLMMDKDTGRPRGFGFVTFDSETAVEACIDIPLEILGKPIEVKRAQPRGNMREEEESGRGGRGRFRKGGGNEDRQDNSGNNQQPQQGGNQMAPGGMTPQVMAQYWQRMQHYFALMQSQMMGAGRGMGAVNPAMMAQMQQMQQMQVLQQQQQQQGMGGGPRSQSPQSPATQMAAMQGMNPAMMAQMQQMQQMQAMQQGMGAANMQGASNAFGGSNPGGRIGTPGYNAYEQQIFEQQKYEQQQQRRATRDQASYGQQGYVGGSGNGSGGPTSWEGMYDDVPQPPVQNQPQPRVAGTAGSGGASAHGRGSAPPTGPAPAPPAGAPTGPKNAGKPGANYRGGGRAGARGYHPYARGN